MRVINSGVIRDAVKELALKANIELRKDILLHLKKSKRKETNAKAKHILGIIIKNAEIAKKKKLPICQDTGMAVVYLGIGQGVAVKGDINKAVRDGICEAYKTGYFRKSVVKDPFTRVNTKTNLPAVLHTRIVPGNKIDIKVIAKGFGCENGSVTKMFNPTVEMPALEDFIVDAVRGLGSNGCPPMYIGIGIGGTLDKAVALSKEAVLRDVGKSNKEKHIAKLEKRLLKKINDLKIGPMGVGGCSTAIGVSVLAYPTHIAGLPVAVNISCHATRGAGKQI